MLNLYLCDPDKDGLIMPYPYNYGYRWLERFSKGRFRVSVNRHFESEFKCKAFRMKVSFVGI